jgi:NAD(P)-dependent dehydrogenase (short-subunit alcohol dehydrogenase family)
MRLLALATLEHGQPPECPGASGHIARRGILVIVVNLSSLVVPGFAQRSAYAAAKSAMISLTRTWGLEVAATGITVNAIAPGPVETGMFRENTPKGSEAEQRFLSMVPTQRLGKPDELAASIAFLLSEEAGFITGQTLFVDGGTSIGRASF